MKSGIKNVDKSGNSAPIRSQKAQKRLEDYKARAQPDEKSQEFDGKALYFMEGGLRHGRVPIAHGAVDKEEVLAAKKSSNMQQTNNAAYRSVVQENEELRRQMRS